MVSGSQQPGSISFRQIEMSANFPLPHPNQQGFATGSDSSQHPLLHTEGGWQTARLWAGSGEQRLKQSPGSVQQECGPPWQRRGDLREVLSVLRVQFQQKGISVHLHPLLMQTLPWWGTGNPQLHKGRARTRTRGSR